MNLIPKALVVGIFMPPPGVPGTGAVTPEKLNRIWNEVGPSLGYRQLQLAPDGTGAQFIGSTPQQSVTIQPPLLQVMDPIELTPGQSLDKAVTILKAAERHLGISQFFNLGIRHIYHAPMPDNDSRGFVMARVLRWDPEDLSELEAGGKVTAGVKFYILTPAVNYTLSIEPFIADPSQLILDLDAQFPGPTALDSVKNRAEDADDYLTKTVKGYLDRLSSP
jgi:hypothetical protein